MQKLKNKQRKSSKKKRESVNLNESKQSLTSYRHKYGSVFARKSAGPDELTSKLLA